MASRLACSRDAKTTGLSATGTLLPKGSLDGRADRLPDTLLGERRDFLGQYPRELTLIGLRGPDNPVDLMVGHLHDLANPPAPVRYLPSLGGCHEFMTIDGIDITAADGDADVQLPTHEEFVEETMMRKNDNNRHPMHQLFPIMLQTHNLPSPYPLLSHPTSPWSLLGIVERRPRRA